MPIALMEEQVAVHTCAMEAREVDDECVQISNTGTCLTFNPRLHLVRLSFAQTPSEEESTIEAHAIDSDFLQPLYKRFPRHELFMLIDFSTSDDSSVVSAEALRIYGTLLKSPHIARVVCYNVQPGMRTIVKILSHVPNAKNKILMVDHEPEARALYETWAHGDPSLRMLPA